MISQADWTHLPASAGEGKSPLFFTDHEWGTIDAATARIIPTDRDPGAREAGVVRFLDRFLSGIDYVYATPRGDGFLQMSGKDAEIWRQRIKHRQQIYREGLRRLDELSEKMHRRQFIALPDGEQDEVLETISGRPKPTKVVLGHAVEETKGEGGAPPTNQPVSDEGLDFFHMLVLHTRQGFYADPAYGGNRNRIGWRVIGYPGPMSLADTADGTYSTLAYMLPEATWPYAQHPQVQRYRLSPKQF
jgi:gluconate 2-dehydrogenase gamma chain